MICTTVGHVNELVSIVIPLQETLPGWPTAPEHSWFDTAMVLVIIPVALALIVGLVALGGALARRGRTGSTRQTEPVWLGSTASKRALTADSAAETTGGASVRW